MEALLFSTVVVALAEMSDKTQLLSFVLAAKFRRKAPIALGILIATLTNHFLAGYVGTWLASLVSPQKLKWIVALSFFIFAAWALKPDKLDENHKLRGAGVFLTTHRGGYTEFFVKRRTGGAKSKHVDPTAQLEREAISLARQAEDHFSRNESDEALSKPKELQMMVSKHGEDR